VRGSDGRAREACLAWPAPIGAATPGGSAGPGGCAGAALLHLNMQRNSGRDLEGPGRGVAGVQRNSVGVQNACKRAVLHLNEGGAEAARSRRRGGDLLSVVRRCR
jgi:hypothetical protein